MQKETESATVDDLMFKNNHITKTGIYAPLQRNLMTRKEIKTESSLIHSYVYTNKNKSTLSMMLLCKTICGEFHPRKQQATTTYSTLALEGVSEYNTMTNKFPINPTL
ncbi:hypothetical protein BT93_K0578 [Corymbia citriodora subsp. variegata]|nr:hypothetical protein BT93_K0578 [Corymbia citriodora subsp. variegata]